MHNKSVIGIFIVMFCFSLVGFASAVPSVSLSSDTVSVSGLADNEYMYGYEIDVNYTIDAPTITDGGYLGSGGDIVSGTSDDSSNKILTVYVSRLDSGRTGFNSDGDLFSLSSYTGEVSLGCKFFVYNSSEISAIDCPAPASTGTTTTTTSSSSGGGGGATAGRVLVAGLAVDVKNINMELVLNSYKERIIKITNLGDSEKTISVGQSGLEDILVLKEDSFVLGPGGSKEIRAVFIAPKETGIFTGKMHIGGQEVLVALTVRSKELLFDALIAVPEGDKLIKFGDKLDTQITLIPMGEDPRVDVTLHYIVKDYDGNILLEESETILVDEQKDFGKKFNTNNLPVGNYIVGLEVVYPNGVAAASSHFEVVKSKPLDMRKILFLVISILVVLMVLVVIFMIAYKRKRGKKGRRR
jgi:hypothetical protein